MVCLLSLLNGGNALHREIGEGFPDVKSDPVI